MGNRKRKAKSAARGSAERAQAPRGSAGRRGSPVGSRAGIVLALVVLAGALGAGYWLVSRSGGGVREGVPSALRSGAARGFNVLLVSLDTTRADHIGCYGYSAAKTPVLDGLAREGLRFEQAISPVPLTLPSHTTMLTGLEPPSHGVRHNGEYRLDPVHVTLAEILKDQGYQTAAFVSAFVLDHRFGLDQGFDYYDDTVRPQAGDAFGGYDSQRNAEEVTAAAVQWLKARSKDRPYFLWVHYYDPHANYEPPAPFAAMFPDRLYDGEIAYMDVQIGRLMRAVNENGGGERVVGIFVGDHGESLDEHDENTHGRGLYDATQRVPLIVWSPGLFGQGHVVDKAVVGVIDVFATVLDVLGLPPQPGDEGESLLTAGRNADRRIYMETLSPYLDSGWAPLYGLRRLHDKYIHAPEPEYYDLSVDPHEVNNLFAQATPPQQERMAALAGDLAERVKGSPSAEDVAASAVELDPDALARLRSLGYFAGRDDERPEEGEALANPRDMMPIWSLTQEATRLRDHGKFAESLAVAQQAYAKAPDDRSVLHAMGLALMYMDRLKEATEYFQRYIAIRPNANVYVSLAQIAVKQGRLEAAEDYINKALALEPDHGAAYIARGDVFAIRGQVDEALRMYDVAEKVDPHRSGVAAANRRAKVRAFLQGRQP
ncbi:MAG: sulfatase-like hydrolase/transferase [Phycisphaerae bacterium]|nr:sulfatase-like hydrolase/transferase [Phycisphaerae bacterium]